MDPNAKLVCEEEALTHLRVPPAPPPLYSVVGGVEGVGAAVA
jgi:hypothetical protein